MRTVLELESLHEVTVEQRGQCAATIEADRGDPGLQRVFDCDRIDAEGARIQAKRVFVRDQAPAVAKDAPYPAQAPAQLRTRIVRAIPEQLAQV